MIAPRALIVTLPLVGFAATASVRAAPTTKSIATPSSSVPPIKAVPPPITAPTITMAPTGAVDANAVVLTFDDYLQRVGTGNLDLAVVKQNISIAQASVAIAKVFPNPTLTAGFSQIDPFKTGYGNSAFVGITVPYQLGGKRAARIDVAEAGVATTGSEVDDALRELRATASDAFVDSLYERLVLSQKKNTLESLEKLVAVNKQRFAAGDVGEVVVLQSKVEADVFDADVLAAEGDVRSADATLVQTMGAAGKSFAGKPLDVRGDLAKTADRTFDVEGLIALAKDRRPDLIAARRRVLLADKEVDLAKANRVIDVWIGGGWTHYFPVSGPTTQMPTADLFSVTLTVPLPFSNVYRGEVHSAVATKQQNSLAVQAAEVRIEAEVRKAVARYNAAAARVRLFKGGTLANATEVVERTLYNYHRGGATLVEVLVAQRTSNSVYLSYYDALAEAAHALVAVDRATASSTVVL